MMKLREAIAIYLRRCAVAENPSLSRCPICDWPLAATREQGCVPGDCSYRPERNSAEWQRIERNRAEFKRRVADGAGT